jgi:hypothetical protein
MAQHAAGARRQQRGAKHATRGQCVMPDGVDAPMDGAQPADVPAVPNRSAAQAERVEMLAVDDAS